MSLLDRVGATADRRPLTAENRTCYCKARDASTLGLFEV